MKQLEKQVMVFLVPYQLTGIQKGIQAGHAALRYARTHGHTDEFKSFVEHDETWIILSAGTANFENVATNAKVCTTKNTTSIYDIQIVLHTWNFQPDVVEIKHESFFEPDLNGMLTAVCFLMPEWLWNEIPTSEWDQADDKEFYENIKPHHRFLKELVENKQFA